MIDEQLTAEIKVLLDDPHLSVTEIAQHFNFPDQSYLSRFFKKNTGMSPKEFRSQERRQQTKKQKGTHHFLTKRICSQFVFPILLNREICI